jgi:hypothetical protein
LTTWTTITAATSDWGVLVDGATIWDAGATVWDESGNVSETTWDGPAGATWAAIAASSTSWTPA